MQNLFIRHSRPDRESRDKTLDDGLRRHDIITGSMQFCKGLKEKNNV